jgi:hypothetical protein
VTELQIGVKVLVFADKQDLPRAVNVAEVTEAAGEEEAAGAAAPLREAGAAEAEEAPEPPIEAGHEVDTKQSVGAAAAAEDGLDDLVGEHPRLCAVIVQEGSEYFFWTAPEAHVSVCEVLRTEALPALRDAVGSASSTMKVKVEEQIVVLTPAQEGLALEAEAPIAEPELTEEVKAEPAAAEAVKEHSDVELSSVVSEPVTEEKEILVVAENVEAAPMLEFEILVVEEKSLLKEVVVNDSDNIKHVTEQLVLQAVFPGSGMS